MDYPVKVPDDVNCFVIETSGCGSIGSGFIVCRHFHINDKFVILEEAKVKARLESDALGNVLKNYEDRRWYVEESSTRVAQDYHHKHKQLIIPAVSVINVFGRESIEGAMDLSWSEIIYDTAKTMVVDKYKSLKQASADHNKEIIPVIVKRFCHTLSEQGAVEAWSQMGWCKRALWRFNKAKFMFDFIKAADAKGSNMYQNKLNELFKYWDEKGIEYK